jgi:hypothetical protein
MSSADIVAVLGEMDTRPWPEWKAGKPITATQMARVLKPFRVRPTTHRPEGGGKPVKGYLRNDFTEAWNRYLPADPSSTAAKGASDPKHGNNAVQDYEFRGKAPVTPNSVLPFGISDIRSSGQRSCGVTGQIPPQPHRQSGIGKPDAVDAMGEAEGEL